MEKGERKRCRWALDELRGYHDAEWGRFSFDEKRAFAFLLLEMFQSGLSWLTIYRKKEGFKEAFAGFDVQKVALFTQNDVERLLLDPSIVRNKKKIEAAVTCARHFIEVASEFGGFVPYLLSFTGGQVALRPVESPSDQARALSKDLKRRGFAFLGPIVVQSYLEAMGILDGHEEGCAFAPGGPHPAA